MRKLFVAAYLAVCDVIQAMTAESCLSKAWCAEEIEDKLLVELFKGYHPQIRPVPDVNSPPLIVHVGLQLILLVNVVERNQIMQTNVWMLLAWKDFQMTWLPEDYGNITMLQLPPGKVWLPDIVLFNNADGEYEPTFFSNAVVKYTGDVQWVPPAIFKSSCIIDVEHFPFDEQHCYMSFGSWTYSKEEIQLQFLRNVDGVDLSQYAPSTIWDIIDVPAGINPIQNRVDFVLVIRRKFLFYTWVLLIPTVLMAFLSCSVFYLPTDAKEKIGLSIYILVSIDVFLLLVSKILPPTSKTVPLMAKYLLLTLILNVITILLTVIVVNVYYRSPTTHEMPEWIRWLFLKVLARILLMRRPKRRSIFVNSTDWERRALKVVPADAHVHPDCNSKTLLSQPISRVPFMPLRHHPNCPFWSYGSREKVESSVIEAAIEADQDLIRARQRSRDATSSITANGWRVIKIVDYITDHLKGEAEGKKAMDDWKYVAMVIDRLLLYIFVGVTIGGTIGIFLSAPNAFASVDQEAELIYMKQRYRWKG